MTIAQFDAWHKTTLGYLVFAGLELGLAYLFGSLAIDRGNLWYYLLTVIFFIGFLHNLMECLWKLTGGRSHA